MSLRSDATQLPSALYVWIVPSEEQLDQPGSWRIRKWDTAPFPEANFTLAPSSAVEASDPLAPYVRVPLLLVEFLLGKRSFNGLNFGERGGGMPPFWWRNYLKDLPIEPAPPSSTGARETKEQLRQRFETWFDMTYPLFREGSGRDTTIKHQLWTAWQVAHLGSPAPRSATGSITKEKI